MRTRLALLGPLVLAGLVLPALSSPASAAEATCQGRPATIASDLPSVIGTEGDDVISLSGATQRIDGLGGDDTICASSDTVVIAGAGNDSVLVTGSAAATPTGTAQGFTVLGLGDDSYTGWAGADHVVSLAPGDLAGTNTISTGAGADTVASGSTGEPDRDRIDLGDGDDVVDLVLLAGSAPSLTGGSGGDVLGLSTDRTDPSWSVDLGTGVVGTDTGVLVGASSFDGVALSSAAAGLSVLGTPAPNLVSVYSPVKRLDLALGAGEDAVSINATSRGLTGVLDLGGDGGDSLHLSSAQRLRIDLEDEVLRQGGKRASRLTVRGVRDVLAIAPDVLLEGDRRPNDLQAVACRAVVAGGRGADRLSVVPSSDSFDKLYDCGDGKGEVASVGARLVGGKGDDTLIAPNRDDTLLGGPGRDSAHGNGGRDRCVAERRSTCER